MARPSRALISDKTGQFYSSGPVSPTVVLPDLSAEKRPLFTLSPAMLFIIVLALSFVLRIFYAGHLYEDDGLWFTAAEQILRGKALYREIYFDKPPVLPLAYALLFKCFGPHIITIRLFTILYATAISGMLYRIGSRIYGKQEGTLTAIMFAFFSTSYVAGHVQALNTDFLMVAPYTAAAYLFVRSNNLWSGGAAPLRSSLRCALGGGILTGIACQINPKGLFDLVFFAFLLIFSLLYRHHRTDESRPYAVMPSSLGNRTLASGALLLGASGAGMITGCLPFLYYIARSHALTDYWVYVWLWGLKYSNYYPVSRVMRHGFLVTAGYLLLNDTLAVALIVMVVAWIRNRRRTTRGDSDATFQSVDCIAPTSLPARSSFAGDASVLLWLVVSFIGLSLGGRFFPHYFFQVLPALCLLGSRGLVRVGLWFSKPVTSVRHQRWKMAAVALLASGFIVTLVRYHSRTFWLAADWVTGHKSQATRGWYHDVRNHEERMAAAIVTGRLDDTNDVDKIGLETIRKHWSKDAQPMSSDYLFVWGYRPWIYYWSGLVPASKFLSAQPLTGVAAGSEFERGEIKPILRADEAARSRAELLKELAQTKPLYIVDEWGMYNPALGIKAYPEMRAFLTSYKAIGGAGNLWIYRRNTSDAENASGTQRSIIP